MIKAEKNMISVVIPLKDEAENLPLLYERLIKVLENRCNDFEIIFVDDGSVDDSFEILQKLKSKNPKVKLARLKKNFGKSTALAVGFAKASGELVFTIDADLQNEPEVMPKFLAKISEGYDVVSGWRQNQKDPFYKLLQRFIFNSVMSKASGLPLHDFNCGLRLVRRKVIEKIDFFDKFHPFLLVLAAKKGFRIAEVPVGYSPRIFGKSKYGLRLGALVDIFKLFLPNKATWTLKNFRASEHEK